MTVREFDDAIIGLYAYDTGATDSGIHDERLRQRVKEELDKPDAMAHLTRVARRFLVPPYTLECCKAFIAWLGEYMDYDV